MRIKKKYLYSILLCILLSLPSCSDEKDKDNFDGVGKLISSRNSARYKKAEKKKKKDSAMKKAAKNKKTENSTEKPIKKKAEKKKFSSDIFYEEQIKIISSSSNSTLGVGTAYLNKDGKIVQIKIKRD